MTARADTPLTRDLVPEPRLWRLALRIDQDTLHAVAYSTVQEGALLHRAIPLDPAITSPLRALEEAVYDNPLLLAGFNRTYCVVETRRFALVPTAIAAEADDCERLLAATHPDGAMRGHVCSNPTGDPEATLLFDIDADTAAFLDRTFASPVVCHPLSPLCRYFASAGAKANTPRIWLHLRPGALDVVALDRRRLLMANTYRWRTADDALYYALAVRRLLGLEAPGACEIHIGGHAEARRELLPRLSAECRGSVVAPLIVPAQILHGGAAALDAPFDLMVLPLCE